MSLCPAQSVIPDSPLITLQFSTSDSLPAAPILIGVRNSAGPSAPALTVAVKLSSTTQNWLRVQRVSAQTPTSDQCPQDPGAYVASPGTLTLNTTTDKLCITAARTVTIPGNYSGFITLTPPSGVLAQVVVNLNVIPSSHLLLTADPGVAFNENILSVSTNGAATAPQAIRVDVIDPANPAAKLNAPVSYIVSPNDFLTVTCLQQDRKTPCGVNPSTPLFLQVSVTPTSTMGQLVGSVQIASTNPSYPGNDVITVLANISGLMPMLTIDMTPLVFNSVAGVPTSLPVQSIKIAGTLNFTASAVSDDGTGFLTVIPLGGAAPGTLTIAATPGATRAPGTYTGSIIITPSGGIAVKVPVALKVAGLVATPTAPIAFVCAAGESSKIAVTSTDPSVAIPFAAMASNAPFLVISPASGVTPASLTLTTNCAGLAANTYSTSVMLVATGATTGAQIPVIVTVSPTPMLAVNPTTLAFASDTGKPAVSFATLTVTGNIPIAFTATAQADGNLNWLSVIPSSGRSPGALQVGVNPAGLAASSTPYTGKIVLTYGTAQLIVSVTFTVTTTVVPLLTSSSAASGLPSVAPESIASAYGSNLAATTLTATDLPLPTSLGGLTVTVKDSAGIGRLAPIFFVSPGQVNFLIPAGSASGIAIVTIGQSTGTLPINSIAPGIFTANSNGKGAPAATAALYAADGTVTPEPVFQCGPGVGSCTTVAIPLGTATDQVFLTLYGTGIRGRSAVVNVKCSVAGLDAPVTFADAQGGFVGLDQVNVALPRILAGTGETNLVLTVDGQAANTVRVNIQ
ncbi:MAG: hypothetical protein ACR2I2_09360 [Bryobacteraceae bacterium]